MSENRFEGGLDLDESFGADYVAKKQEPEPEVAAFNGTQYTVTGVANYSTYVVGGGLSDQSQYVQNQYQNVFNQGQGFSNATQYLAGTGVSQLNPYMQQPEYNPIVETRTEFDYAYDCYIVRLKRANGEVSCVRVSDLSEVSRLR